MIYVLYKCGLIFIIFTLQNLGDEIYAKRHQKPEIEEKRRKRYDACNVIFKDFAHLYQCIIVVNDTTRPGLQILKHSMSTSICYTNISG